jgi:hypothetical protein
MKNDMAKKYQASLDSVQENELRVVRNVPITVRLTPRTCFFLDRLAKPINESRSSFAQSLIEDGISQILEGLGLEDEYEKAFFDSKNVEA